MAEILVPSGGNAVEAVGRVTGSSALTTITSGASAHAKGAWVELVAATAYTYEGFFLDGRCTGSPAGLVDLAVGASGSEQIVVPDLLVDPSGSGAHFHVWVPLRVPRGTRLAARYQNSAASQTATLGITGLGPGFLTPGVCGRATAYGIVAASTAGTEVDSGATANTKGAWSELAASTAHVARAIMIEVTRGGTAWGSTVQHLVDIGIGAAGSEQPLLPNVAVRGLATEGPRFQPFAVLCSVPAGTRIAARSQASTTEAGSRKIGVAVHIFA